MVRHGCSLLLLQFTRLLPCQGDIMREGKRRGSQIVPRDGDVEEREKLMRPDDGQEEDVQISGSSGKRGNSRLQKWPIGVFLFLCVFVIVLDIIYEQFTISRPGRFGNRQESETEGNTTTDSPAPVSDPGFVVRTKGCRIPAFEVLDPNIKQYFKDISPFQCQAGTHLPLVISNLTSLIVDPAAVPHFYNSTESVDCCWRQFRRAAQSDNKITYEKTCQSFKNVTKIADDVEFVKIECHRNGTEVYKDYHAFVPRKDIVEERCKNDTASFQGTGDKVSERLSVLILGLDAVSRLNFHRMMPKTVETLKNLEAVEMLGYNKVADNTFPNMIPVLTGMSEGELAKSCWKTKKKSFDDCRFVWQNFSLAGYRTILGEDACYMSIFNYLKSGFKNQPTDYYLRPYCVAIENDIGNTHKLNADLCVGTRKTFENLLSYGKKIAEEFRDDAYFAFFWQASLTHDFVTYPKLGDESYAEFVNKSYEKGLLNRTALIVMSDHGIRWGGFRQTYQGHVEESLPFVFVLLPEWWRDKYPIPWANLRRNSRSLTTPFDLHETLLHLLKPEELIDENKMSDKKSRLSEKVPRGLSWFLPIPDHRNCGMAGIPGHWCMCHLSKNASTSDPLVRKVVDYLIKELNGIVRDYPQCSALSLARILDTKVWSDESQKTDKKRGKDPPTVDYTVSVQTRPGDAIFEATVRRRGIDSDMKLVGSISRLNLYGKQSSCVDDFKMRLYCYCSNR